MRVRLLHGDCKARMAGLRDESIGAVIVDPPYGLEFMGKGWDKLDATDQAHISAVQAQQMWHREWLEQVHRILRPGGIAKVFGGTRLFHRLAGAMVDVGFVDIRLEGWGYGSGFPKSLDVSKAIDKMHGAKRELVRTPYTGNALLRSGGQNTRPWMEAALENGYHEAPGKDPVTEDAALWEGWGTALKPAWEPVLIGIKPGGPGSTETP